MDVSSLRFLLALGGSLVALASQAAENPAPGVTTETNRALYVVGDTVEVTVTNSRNAPIWIAGCNPLSLERFENERYLPVAGARCVGEGDAVKIPPGTHKLSWVATGEHSGQIFRMALAFGWGCEDGRALSQSRCQDFATAYSTSVRVGRRGDGAAPP
jgi:hypothetical protein